MTALPPDTILFELRSTIDAAAAVWLESALASSGDVAVLCRSYTAAPKHVGRGPLSSALRDSAAWTVDDAARCALLQAAAQRMDAGAFTAAAVECFERGDSREQQSWLRGISLLPDPVRFLAMAIDACRTNIVPLFESIACENSYPAAFFPAPNFNQMVLKALFNNLAVRRISGLRERLNPELSRMARDYADERRAAGRSVPSDIEETIR